MAGLQATICGPDLLAPGQPDLSARTCILRLNSMKFDWHGGFFENVGPI